MKKVFVLKQEIPLAKRPKHGNAVFDSEDVYSAMRSFQSGDRSPSTVEALQRQFGNRWLSGQTRTQPSVVQRYVEVDNYQIGNAAAGNTVFESQSLNLGGDAPGNLTTGYSRTQTKRNAANDGFEKQNQTYNKDNRTWEDDGAAEAMASGPQLKVSTNTLFATEKTSQARYVYMAVNQIDGINATLAQHNQSKFVRLVSTGGPTIQINGQTLVQVKAELVDRAKDEVVEWTQIECQAAANEVAGKASGVITRNALDEIADSSEPGNENALPDVGQTFGFRQRANAKSNRELVKKLPKKAKFRSKMREIVNQLRPVFNNVMNGVAVDYSRIGLKARMFLPGWAEHFETVVAQDGEDRLTLVNYNRTVEKRTEKRRIFIHLMQDQRIFDAFVDYVMTKKEANPEMKWLNIIAQTVGDFLRDNPDLINTVQAGLAEEIKEIDFANAMDMMYFDLYGSADTSFHAKYEKLSRGHGGETYVME